MIVCSAGKFGERWAEIAKAYGLDATVLTAEYGDVVSADQVADTLKKDSSYKGVFVQASETSTGAAHDVKGMAAAIRKTDALFVVDAITGLGTQPLDIDGWGLDVVVGGSQKSFMIPPGLGVPFGQRQSLVPRRFIQPAQVLLQPEEGAEERAGRRIQLDA